MKRLLMTTAGVFALAMAAQPASAADLPTKAPAYMAPVVAPMFDWTGFYGGIHGGYGWGRARWEHVNDNWWASPGDIFRHRPNGWLVGGHVGANRQVGTWVYGLEGSLAWTNLEKDSISPTFPDLDRFRTRVSWLGTFTGRVGHAWDRSLLYVKAGLAGGRVKLRAYDFESPPNIDTSSRFHYGWTAGVGAETVLTSNWTLGIEYNYINLRSKRHVGNMTTEVNYIVSPKVQIHAVMFRVSHLFATGKAPGPVMTRY